MATRDARSRLAEDLSAGFAGGLAALAGEAVAHSAFGTVILPQIAVDATSSVLPTPWFGHLLDRLQSDAKPLLYGGIVAGELLSYLGIALLAGALSRRGPKSLQQGLRPALAIGMALSVQVLAATTLVAFTEAGAPSDGWLAYIGVAAVLSVIFGVATEAFHLWFFTQADEEYAEPVAGRQITSRRRLLNQGSTLALVVMASVFVSHDILDQFGSAVKRRLRGSPSPPVTSNDDFYEVSKNLFGVNVSDNDWRLDIDGLVVRPLSLTLANIRSRPAIDTYNTFECISNQVGGDLISNALWKGIMLRS